jgi:LDH2 family malate/lactate/ureidoglycolate dehydrogenase
MKIPREKLLEATEAIMKGFGADDNEAAQVANGLVKANARGIHSHGVKYLGMIGKRIKANQMQVGEAPEVLSRSRALSLIDGKNGLGQVAATRAMALAVENAREFGISITFVRNTNNVGFLSHYAMMAAKEGMIGICACNAASSISLWGGLEAVLGSNPISMAFPSDPEAPLVMDLSMSNVARGKIREADRLGKKIPAGWAFGPDGKPTEDPAEALKGGLMPIGGPKGVALAIAVDILAGMVSGSKYSQDVQTFHKLEGATGVGAFFIAIDPKDIIDPDALRSLLSEYVADIKDIKKAPSTETLYLPGEIEHANEMKSNAEGIELDDGAIETLNEMLKDAGSDISL